jgi:hypothetical protein
MATNATTSRSNMLTVTLVAAILEPRVERWLGIQLTTDDVVAIIGGTVAAWHAAVTAFVRYFPPPADPPPTRTPTS